MKIFNSLGSNYNFNFVFQSIFSKSKNSSRDDLKSLLEEKYDGKAILTYKGREALTLALTILNLPKESAVAINGFTCFAVYKAIGEARCKTELLDIEYGNLNFSFETLSQKIKQNPKIKAVIVQNTLGYPCEIDKIQKICQENNIFLIEDLAHCVGTLYQNGKEAGTVGDFITLSFSQDKVIDAVSGGALIIRNRKYKNLTTQQPARIAMQSVAGRLNNVNICQQLKDHLYPLFTYKIRFLYNSGLGKPLHFVLKTLNLLSKPMQEGLYDFYSLPNWYCNLALIEFSKLDQQLNHRKEIAKIYAENLNKKILQEKIINKIEFSANLRFPIFVENREELIKFLKNSKIFISDIWYDDVAPECPNAVEISKIILNLPTHINVTKEDALKIAERVNIWLKSQ